MDINSFISNLKIIKEWPYKVTPLDKGYTDKILYINVSDNSMKVKDVPPLMKEKFVGGKGYGKRKNAAQPYRAAGPVTKEEYLSMEAFYDKKMKEIIGIDPTGKSVEEKIAITRKYHEDQYEKLLDAVYERRGWTKNGIPTIEHLKKLGMDLPELIETIKPYL